VLQEGHGGHEADTGLCHRFQLYLGRQVSVQNPIHPRLCRGPRRTSATRVNGYPHLAAVRFLHDCG
jgi:hypothetical protein